MKQPKLLLAIALVALGGLPAARAASTAILGRIVLRPLTPTDKTWYSLPAATETSGGLSTIGVGTPAYLEAQASGVVASNTTVSWSITSKPLTSAATLTASPFGSNVPMYEPSDSQVLKYALVGSRLMLRPDLEGQYVVTASITNGTTLKTNVSVTITAASYLGWYNGCIACHSGSAWVLAPDKSSWTNTAHAIAFTQNLNGQSTAGSHFGQNCISCHSVGYNTNASANAGGFYQQQIQNNWTLPAVFTNTNWAYMQANYPTVANLANIQCENCHGPGSEHIIFGGKVGNTNTISVNWNSGTCDQCHDATTRHIKGTEWRNSRHAIAPNQGGATCGRCHTAQGFANFVRGATAVSTAYNPVTCSACHDPHDATNPYQLRTVKAVTLGDGMTITNAGSSAICLECHQLRNGPASTNIVNYSKGLPTWAGGSSFGTHHSSQGELFYGTGGYTYGLNIPSSAHRDAIQDPCVTCHMQATPASTDPKFLHTGGHTFNVVYESGTTNLQMTEACATCHGKIEDVSLVRGDYNGDGVIEDVQTEVQSLLDKLSTMLPTNNAVKTSLSVTTNWTLPQLRAAYNWQFVSEDRSKGIHNVAYAVGLLKASIADLNPYKNGSNIPDSWFTQYLGSYTNANATPNASPAGDGIPNWVKYALGLNPLVAGVVVPDGVVWANNDASNPSGPLHIYTAAEVTFPTANGTTYQIQGLSQLDGTWQNIGSPIQGTGNTMSYLTPTRNNTQQFFRVVHTP